MNGLIKFRLANLPQNKLKALSVNPIIRTEKKKLIALRNAIQKSNIVVPLVTTFRLEKYIILDGNRRFSVCKELSIENIPCLIIEDQRLKLEELFVLLNLQLKMDGYQRLIIMKEAGIFFNKREEQKYNYLLDIGGSDIIDLMIEKQNNVAYTHHWLIEITKYLKVYSKEDIKPILFWLVENKQQYQIRKALEMKVNKNLISKAIEQDRALKGYVFN